MKKSCSILSSWFILFFIIGCGKEEPYDHVTESAVSTIEHALTQEPELSGENITHEETEISLIVVEETDTEIFLPEGMGNPPEGILEQVSWFGGGGGSPRRECGECWAFVDVHNNLKITDFAPHQKLSLVLYRKITGPEQCGFGVGEFVTIVQVKVDRNGSLSLPLIGAGNIVYVNTVIDTETGNIQIPGETTLQPACASPEPFACSGAPESRIHVGESAYVCTRKDRLIVRAKPSSTGGEIMRIETGTGFEVIAGPQCSNSMFWWKIDINGTIGWVSEGGDNVDPYFICPAK